MEWKACREQHPGGMGEVFPHTNTRDQRNDLSKVKKNGSRSSEPRFSHKFTYL